MPVYRILGELIIASENNKELEKICDNFELDLELTTNMLWELAEYLKDKRELPV